MASSSNPSVSKGLPIRMISTVVRGFGRGSKDLGIPTANLDPCTAHFCCATSVADLPTGIYWGFARIDSDATTYKTACSVGFNPVYGNDHKTIEPHLIAPTDDPQRHISTCGESVLGDFYDKKIRLSLVGYLRPELPFEGLEKLIEAIKKDIVDAETLGDGQEEATLQEKAWVASSDDVSK